MSQLEVDKIIPQSGTTLTIGDSGDTINFADGQNINIDSNTLYIDSTNNRVGIGTSSPSGKLQVTSASSGATLNSAAGQLFLENSGNAGITIGSGTSSLGLIYFADSGDGNIGRLEYSHSGNSMRFWTNDSERMRITSTGDVGIGTSSPNNQLEIKNSATSVTVRLACDSGSGRDYGIVSTVGGAFGIYDYDASAYRTTIDSSGNFFVATTTEASDDVGHALLANGAAYHTADGTYVGLFNRKSSDGEIVQFRKDNTVIGTIGSREGRMYLHSPSPTGSGLRMGDAFIQPCDSDGSDSDNDTSLGQANSRFTDLYLSDGIYLGGTGTANKLDDYEEGTFTTTLNPLTSGSVSLTYDELAYRKIGNVVYITGEIRVSSVSSPTGAFQITNLPFAVGDFSELSERTAGIGYRYEVGTGSSPLLLKVNSGFTALSVQEIVSGNATAVDASDLQAGSEIVVQMFYFTD